jgi:hypothetical protein
MTTIVMALKALVLTLLAMSLTLTPMIWAEPLTNHLMAGLTRCPASQEVPAAAPTINAGVTCDNDFVIYVGDCCVATTFIGNNSCDVLNSCIRAGKQFTIGPAPAVPAVSLTGSSYIYIVAWSDGLVAQGLLASFQGPHATILSGDPQWQVYATNVTFPSSPGAKKFTKFLNAQLSIACDGNLWTAPAVGGTNQTGNTVPGGSGTNLEPIGVSIIPGAAKWIWFQSGKPLCAGPNSPFAPGCNHNEYLIFRLPASYL